MIYNDHNKLNNGAIKTKIITIMNIEVCMASKAIRHEFNPFTQDMMISKRSKQVRVSPMGKDKNVLVNQDTGEVKGTQVVTYRQVDSAQFVKLFAENIAMTFNLKAAGFKSFNVLMYAVQSTGWNTDTIELDSYLLEKFNETHDLTLSRTVFTRGLGELENAQIIAKTIRKGRYYINPNFVFNGDRISFSQVIERVDGDAAQQDSLELN